MLISIYCADNFKQSLVVAELIARTCYGIEVNLTSWLTWFIPSVFYVLLFYLVMNMVNMVFSEIDDLCSYVELYLIKPVNKIRARLSRDVKKKRNQN